MAHLLGGKVSTAPVREYGKTNVTLDKSSELFDGIETDGIAWMSHTDYIEEAPEGFKDNSAYRCLSCCSYGK